jgi:uncharacterized protein (TIRG00374 family)
MRRFLAQVVRIVLGVGALAWLLSRVDADAAWATVKRADLGWLGVAMVAQLGSKGFWLFRWRELLGSAREARSLIELGRLMLLGLFFNNFLPSSVGGDVARGVGLAGLGISRAQAAASVLADRVVGMYALAVTAALGSALGAWLWPERGPWIAAGCVSLAFALVTQALFRSEVLGRVERIRAISGESGLARKSRRLLAAGKFLADHRQALRRAFLFSLGLSACSTIYHWAIGRSLGIGLPFAAYCVLVPAVMMFASLPITLNGLGIREVTFVGLLGAQGVPREEATVFALLAFLGTLGFAIAGGWIFVAGRLGRTWMREEPSP